MSWRKQKWGRNGNWGEGHVWVWNLSQIFISFKLKANYFCCVNFMVREWFYPQKSESLAHINVAAAGSVAAEPAAVCVIVVVVHIYAVLPGTEPLIVRPVRVATAIKCHFHSGDCFGFTRLAAHTDNNSFTFHWLNWIQLEYSTNICVIGCIHFTCTFSLHFYYVWL